MDSTMQNKACEADAEGFVLLLSSDGTDDCRENWTVTR
jgi:hypothetical protein